MVPKSVGISIQDFSMRFLPTSSDLGSRTMDLILRSKITKSFWAERYVLSRADGGAVE